MTWQRRRARFSTQTTLPRTSCRQVRGVARHGMCGAMPAGSRLGGWGHRFALQRLACTAHCLLCMAALVTAARAVKTQPSQDQSPTRGAADILPVSLSVALFFIFIYTYTFTHIYYHLFYCLCFAQLWATLLPPLLVALWCHTLARSLAQQMGAVEVWNFLSAVEWLDASCALPTNRAQHAARG